MRYEKVMGEGVTSPPFLTVVTRCYKRPEFLKNNLESLKMQTVQNYEQILIIDEVGQGVYAANKSLANARPMGQYVMVLDDDDLLTDHEAIETLLWYVEQEQNPELVFFKADHDWLGVLPSRSVWGRRPVHGHVGSCDFISRRDIWEQHITAFGAPHSGDYSYLQSIWNDAPCVAWLDRKIAAVQRISGGKPQ